MTGSRGFEDSFKFASFDFSDIVVFVSRGCAIQGDAIMLPTITINIHADNPVNKFLLVEHILRHALYHGTKKNGVNSNLKCTKRKFLMVLNNIGPYLKID